MIYLSFYSKVNLLHLILSELCIFLAEGTNAVEISIDHQQCECIVLSSLSLTDLVHTTL